ncbi:nucleoside-diphosphate kinase [Pancytospora philotis]|nr:nucleoside-diphosphate kinase [Pancytospora philotis]
MERTFVMIKNDGVARRLVGRIISRFEECGLYLVQSKVLVPSKELLHEHYAAHKERDFFKGMVETMAASQVVPMVWEGANAVAIARKLIGATNPLTAAVGTIRGDFSLNFGKNIIHGADSVESAKHEIKLWFGEDVPSVKHFDKDVVYE